MKWMISSVIALLAAGGGIVALLNYMNPSQLEAQETTQAPASVTQQTYGDQSPSVANVGGDVTINIESAASKPKEVAKFNRTINIEKDACQLRRFLKDHLQETIYLELTFILRQSGGITDLGVNSPDFSDITVDNDCVKGEKETGSRLLFEVDKKFPYFWGRNENGDGWVLKGQFIPNWVEHVGQGYYRASLTSTRTN